MAEITPAKGEGSGGLAFVGEAPTAGVLEEPRYPAPQGAGRSLRICDDPAGFFIPNPVSPPSRNRKLRFVRVVLRSLVETPNPASVARRGSFSSTWVSLSVVLFFLLLLSVLLVLLVVLMLLGVVEVMALLSLLLVLWLTVGEELLFLLVLSRNVVGRPVLLPL